MRLIFPQNRGVHARRRGFTSVLAMLFLVLLTTLSLGFFAQVSTSVQIADNEAGTSNALFAAESGLQFLRYQMSAVKLPAGTASAQVFNSVATQLKARLDGTTNLGGGTLTVGTSSMGIPTAGYVATDSTSGAGFRIDLADGVGSVVATFTGRASTTGLTRQIKLTFAPQATPTTVFNYAIAAQGQIQVTKDSVTGPVGNSAVASLMSTDASPAITMSGGLVGGTLNVTVSTAYAQVTGGTVNGDSNLNTIKTKDINVVTAPEFPKIDTTQFAPYATNQYSTWKTGSPYSNLYVKKTDSVRFKANDVINGILYIESGANVSFAGNATVNGIIVVQNANTTNYTTVDTLTFNGDVTQGPLPNGSTYSNLTSVVQGYSIVAPTTAVSMSGNVHSYLNGTAVVGTMAFGGNSNITVTKGSMISYSVVTDADALGGKTINFTGQAKDNPPSFGMSFSQVVVPTANTYEELSP